MIKKYQENTRVGPKDVLFIRRIPSERKGSYGEFECYTCHQTFQARLDHVVSGATYNCPACRGKKYEGRNNPNFVDLTGKEVGKLTVIEYTGKGNKRRSIWRCRCACGNIIELDSNQIQQGGKTSCGKCNYHSRGEWVISTALTELGIDFIPQKTFDTCKDIRPLPFDFYLPDSDCCIEYDGISHYCYNPHGSWNTPESVEKTQKHDKIKTEWCAQNNIQLIRIPYWDLEKINADYLRQLINQ